MSKISKYQIQLQQEIDRRASFMSATKWKALFSILKEANLSYKLKVKLLLDTEIREMVIPDTENFVSGKYIEEYWGVFELREIEWLFIPAKIVSERKNREEVLAPKITSQPIEAIEKEFQKGKQFEYELVESGLKIYGYK